MTGPTEFRWRPRQTVLHGIPVIVAEYDIPDSAPEDLKEALGRRTLVRENAVGVLANGTQIGGFR
jgi:hypothetical protein